MRLCDFLLGNVSFVLKIRGKTKRSTDNLKVVCVCVCVGERVRESDRRMRGYYWDSVSIKFAVTND